MNQTKSIDTIIRLSAMRMTNAAHERDYVEAVKFMQVIDYFTDIYKDITGRVYTFNNEARYV